MNAFIVFVKFLGWIVANCTRLVRMIGEEEGLRFWKRGPTTKNKKYHMKKKKKRAQAPTWVHPCLYVDDLSLMPQVVCLFICISLHMFLWPLVLSFFICFKGHVDCSLGFRYRCIFAWVSRIIYIPSSLSNDIWRPATAGQTWGA